jgi:hypothetical protein
MTSERQTKEIVFFGERVFLFERTLEQVYAFSEYAKKQEKTTISNAYLGLLIIHDALQPNIARLKYYQILKKWKLKKMFKTNYLFKRLTQQQIESFVSLIVEDLEGNKKKVEPEESL